MHLRYWFIILLIALLSFGIASAQTNFQRGDKVIFVAGSSPIYPSTTSMMSNAGEISRGTVSTVMAVDETSQRIYLIENAYGWVDSVIAEQPSVVLYDPTLLSQISEEALDAVDENPNNAEAYVTGAIVAVQESRYEDALEILNEILESQPENGYLLYQRSGIYLKLKMWDAALQDAQAAAAYRYIIGNVYNRAGIALEGSTHYELAMSQFANAIGVSPSWALLHNNLANQYHRLRQYEDGIPYYDSALRLDPLLTVAYLGRAGSYQRSGNFNAALENLNTAIQIAPFDADGYLHRATFYSEALQNYEAAVLDYSAALAIEPDNDRIYADLGVSYMFQGDVDNALNNLKQATNLNTSNSHAYYNLATVYANIGNYEQALVAYTHVVDLNDSRSYSARLYRPQLYFIFENYDAALEDLNFYIDNNPGTYFDAVAYMQRAIVYAHQGDYAAAQADLLSALAVQPEFTTYYYQYGSGYRVTPGRIQTLMDLQESVARNADDADQQLNLAELSLQFGLWQVAYESYTKYGELTQNSESDFIFFLGTLESLAYA